MSEEHYTVMNVTNKYLFGTFYFKVKAENPKFSLLALYWVILKNLKTWPFYKNRILQSCSRDINTNFWRDMSTIISDWEIYSAIMQTMKNVAKHLKTPVHVGLWHRSRADKLSAAAARRPSHHKSATETPGNCRQETIYSACALNRAAVLGESCGAAELP